MSKQCKVVLLYDNKLVLIMLNPLLVSRCFFTLVVALFSLCSLNSVAATISAKTSQVFNKPMMQGLEFSQDIRSLKKGDTITLPLADNTLTTFVVNSIKTMDDEATVINATSSDGVDLLLSSDKKATYGSIIGKGIKYTVSSDAKIGTVLVNQNHPTFPKIDLGDDGVIPPGKSPNLPGIEQMAPEQKAMLDSELRSQANISSSGSRIRMLILYSNEFAAGFASPTARINQLLSFTNQSMQRSGIDLEFTLARAQVLNFNNSLSTGTTLNQVQAGTGAFSGVASLRNQVGADMVAVLSFQPGFSSNGIAYVNGDNPNFAFSSTRLSPGCCDEVFAHELGHNMGSGHESVTANPARAEGCTDFNFTGYSCGHGNSSAGWGTIMSRSPLDRQVVNYVFSNPGLSCQGAPCGIPEGQANPADNFRSFNMSRLLVANFRSDPPPPPNPNPSNGNTVIAPVISILLDDDD